MNDTINMTNYQNEMYKMVYLANLIAAVVFLALTLIAPGEISRYSFLALFLGAGLYSMIFNTLKSAAERTKTNDFDRHFKMTFKVETGIIVLLMIISMLSKNPITLLISYGSLAYTFCFTIFCLYMKAIKTSKYK